MIRDLSGDLEHWLLLGETRSALDVAVELKADLRRDGPGFDRLRRAFVGLLGRRGYLVSTPEEIRSSIAEIRDVGPGFDLYDLLEALAALDVAVLPESRCSCDRHPEGGKP